METQKLIRALMSLQGIKQSELSKSENVSKSTLSKYLSGETDLKSEDFVKILKKLGIDLEAVIRNQVNRGIGSDLNSSLGDDLVYLLEKSNPIRQSSIAKAIVTNFKNNKNPDVQSRLGSWMKYSDSFVSTLGGKSVR